MHFILSWKEFFGRLEIDFETIDAKKMWFSFCNLLKRNQNVFTLLSKGWVKLMRNTLNTSSSTIIFTHAAAWIITTLFAISNSLVLLTLLSKIRRTYVRKSHGEI